MYCLNEIIYIFSFSNDHFGNSKENVFVFKACSFYGQVKENSYLYSVY